jgi:hypothetical protein
MRQQQQIEAAAFALLQMRSEPGDTIERVAESINSGDGFSFDLPVPGTDNWLHCEHVRLSTEELQEAIQIAYEIVRKSND